MNSKPKARPPHPKGVNAIMRGATEMARALCAASERNEALCRENDRLFRIAYAGNEALMVEIRKLRRENERLLKIANLGLKARDYWVAKLGLPEGSIDELRADVVIASTFGEMSGLERVHGPLPPSK